MRADILDKKFTFESAAQFISQDNDTKNNHGRMTNPQTGSTRFEMKDLPQEVAKVINTMEEGQISEAFIMKDPKRNSDIVAIVKLMKRIPAHRANMSDDYQTIKAMYEANRKEEIVKEWLDKKIKDTYIKVEDNWTDCDFQHDWLKLKK